MPSLLIRSAHILDLALPFEPADVLVDGSRIVRVQSRLDHPADRVIEATGKILMPGLINAHTHSGQILDRGLGDNMTLDQWMIYVALGGPPLSARELYVLAAWSALAQLKTGCTSCLDHPSVPVPILDEGSDAIMQAYVDTGFRAAVALSFGDMDFFQTLPLQLAGTDAVPTMGRAPAKTQDVLDGARRFVRRWRGKHDRVQPFVGPSAPQRCSDELLTGCFALSREFETGLHTHVLEARSQAFACRERFGCTPIAHFKRQGWLSQRLSCAHGVWLESEDLELLAGSGAAVAHNPVSNLRLASGIANLQRMLSIGVTVALGADGAASNDNQNMWEVLKLAATLHKAYGRRRNWVTAQDALRLCLEGGAAVLNQRLGAIAPGYEADLVILGGPDVFLRPKDQMIGSLVYSELGQAVETVVVAGEVVIEGGRSTKVDEAGLHREAEAIVAKVDDYLPQRQAYYEERRPFLEKMLAAVETAEGADGIPIPGK